LSPPGFVFPFPSPTSSLCATLSRPETPPFLSPQTSVLHPEDKPKQEMRLSVSFLSFSSNSSAVTLSRCNAYQGQQQAKESSSRTNRASTTRAVVVHKVRPSSHILHERSKP